MLQIVTQFERYIEEKKYLFLSIYLLSAKSWKVKKAAKLSCDNIGSHIKTNHLCI